MNRRAPALAVACLLLASGCLGGVSPFDDGDSKPEVASLVTDATSEDARELVARHRATLANASSYRGRYERDENDTLAYQRRVVVDRDDRQFVREWRNVSTAAGVVFRNTSGTYERMREPGDESFQYDAWTGDGARFTTESRFAEELPLPDAATLARYDFEYVRSTDQLHYFSADSLDGERENRTGRWNVTDVTNVSARLVVHGDGYIRSFSSSVTTERDDDRTVTLGRKTTVIGLNNVDADRPHWVAEAA